MANNPNMYLAIDSDILRVLTLLDILKKKYGYVEMQHINDINLKKDFNYFNSLFNNVKNGDIKLVIVDAVYQESKHSESLLSFIKEYCYFPNVNAVNYQEKAEASRKLAYAYTQPYEHNGVTYPAPMKAVFIADINKYVPTNDCYIMAQATIENCPLLTGNGKDFIFNQRNDDTYSHERVRGITQINVNHGYFKEETPGHFITSKPIMIGTFSKIIRHKTFETTEQNDKIKADTIL